MSEYKKSREVFGVSIRRYQYGNEKPIWDVYYNGEWLCPGYSTSAEAWQKVAELIGNFKEETQ